MRFVGVREVGEEEVGERFDIVVVVGLVCWMARQASRSGKDLEPVFVKREASIVFADLEGCVVRWYRISGGSAWEYVLLCLVLELSSELELWTRPRLTW